MPGVHGLEMVSRMNSQVPDQIVIGISGYGSLNVRAAFCKSGAFVFVAKPLSPNELRTIIEYAITRPCGRIFKKDLGEMCDDVVGIWCVLHDVAELLAEILAAVGHGNDIAQELLRHKAKHLVNDSISRLGP